MTNPDLDGVTDEILIRTTSEKDVHSVGVNDGEPVVGETGAWIVDVMTEDVSSVLGVDGVRRKR